MKYTSLHGDIIRELYGPVEESLYADLVAALEIARAYQAKCERLEQEVRDLVAINHRYAEDNMRLEDLINRYEAAR